MNFYSHGDCQRSRKRSGFEKLLFLMLLCGYQGSLRQLSSTEALQASPATHPQHKHHKGFRRRRKWAYQVTIDRFYPCMKESQPRTCLFGVGIEAEIDEAHLPQNSTTTTVSISPSSEEVLVMKNQTEFLTSPSSYEANKERNGVSERSGKVQRENGERIPFLKNTNTLGNAIDDAIVDQDETSIVSNQTENIVFGLRNLDETKINATQTTNEDDAVVAEPSAATTISLRKLWKRRHARSLEEGIRREKATSSELSSLLSNAQVDSRQEQGRRLVERTIMGLITALTEEVEDLDVELKTSSRTPIWRKEIDEVRINFSRLSFRPIKMGGMRKTKQNVTVADQEVDEAELASVMTADEAFDIIDKDKSGTLDRDEIAEALSLLSVGKVGNDNQSFEDLASELVGLYDINGDGVVDREEYQKMVEDMAKLKKERQESYQLQNQTDAESNPFFKVKTAAKLLKDDISSKAAETAAQVKSKAAEVAARVGRNATGTDAENELTKDYGSIVMTGLKLDLRRLVFGGIPLIKKVSEESAS